MTIIIIPIRGGGGGIGDLHVQRDKGIIMIVISGGGGGVLHVHAIKGL